MESVTRAMAGLVGPVTPLGAGGGAIACAVVALSALLAFRLLSSPTRSSTARVPVIASIGTAVPRQVYTAAEFLRLVSAAARRRRARLRQRARASPHALPLPLTSHTIHHASAQCVSAGYDKTTMELVTKVVDRGGIKTRHTCNADVEPENFVAALDVSTRKRAELWEENAPLLAVAASRQALAQWPHGDARDVTHVIVHSCTGFSAPGLDFTLITELGLPPCTRKLGVNYMGCFGFFTATYVAKQILAADATGRAVVLVCCAETCSVHVSRSAEQPTPELIVGNTLFADGSAAAIVTHAGFVGKGARVLPPPPPPGSVDPLTHTPIFRLSGLVDPRDGVAYQWALGAMDSVIVPGTAGHMTWKQGLQPGLHDMYLDKGIPDALTRTLAGSALVLLAGVGILNPWRRTAWAIHPGGKAILSGFHKALTVLGINTRGMEASHDVLGRYGNMSSPTIAFVLQRVLTGVGAAHGEADSVFFAGFGPGLTVEYGRLYKFKGEVKETDGEAPAHMPVPVSAPAPAPPSSGSSSADAHTPSSGSRASAVDSGSSGDAAVQEPTQATAPGGAVASSSTKPSKARKRGE